ncbi:MAG: glycosyl hydrolase family 18 protein [Rhizonema sp. PD38]|nr:glycosyl hydrolase family 18 protein [Rhizonema sp. PD38]
MKKILILSANPKNTNQLRLDEEVREIQSAIERSQSRENFQLITKWAVRINDLRRALLDEEPQIVHFSGHGVGTGNIGLNNNLELSSQREAVCLHSQPSGIVLEDDFGQMQLVSTKALTELFELFKDQIDCILLNACYSQTQAEAIYQHIDCVIGMNRAIPDNNAIKFSVGFYDAIALLKKRNRNTKVLVAVGGQTYTNFAQINPKTIANVVKDFGFDGIDVDYESNNVKCSSSNGQISCTSDAEFRHVVRQIRQVLPKPYLVTAAVWSIGAYGEGQWANAQPQGEKTGMTLNLLRSPESKMIDQLHIMSYDAGNTYNPQEALAAYQNYFKGKIVLGVEVPKESWGGNVYTLTKVSNLAQVVVDKNAAGLMLWSLQKQPEGIPSDANPTAEMIAKTACQIFTLSNCQQPLFNY